MHGYMDPYITVVMPVRNEARFIAETLDQLLDQDYPADRFEIIVADGMSDDGTRDIVCNVMRRHPQVKLFDNLKRVSSAGRNVGFRSGRGDYFLVVDGHCYIPDDRLLRNVADCFEKSGADCLGRPQPLDPPGLTLFQKAVALARGSRLGHGSDSMIYGDYEGFASPVSNGAAYRREVFDKIGYVDEDFDAAEDVEFNYRVEKAGLTAYTSPKLAVLYYPRGNLRGLFRQMMRYGVGRCRFIRKHPTALTINQLVPLFFVLGLIMLGLTAFLLLAVGASLPFLLIGSVYALYFIILVVEAVCVAATQRAEYLPLLPMIFLTVHVGIGCGFLKALGVFLNSTGSAGASHCLSTSLEKRAADEPSK
ncbi:MAG TPA: glycosyltransferase family 2 protein [Anaerovoracaceae bacterium]|nr:glycosyltransferase family 2 protein [Anaerovoracaceae bacterium]